MYSYNGIQGLKQPYKNDFSERMQQQKNYKNAMFHELDGTPGSPVQLGPIKLNQGNPRKMRRGGHFIQKAIKHPGALHESLHVPKGKNIPEKKLDKAMHSKNPTLKRRAVLAHTLKGLRHRGPK